MSTIEVHYFAAARAAAGTALERVEAPGTLSELVARLAAAHSGTTEAGMSLASVLERCSFLVDGARSELSASLDDAARVDVLPPFAGG
ncbi:MoaD/ThiS family protein [Corynebacterium frankenforstense]